MRRQTEGLQVRLPGITDNEVNHGDGYPETYIGDNAPYEGILQLPNGAFEWIFLGLVEGTFLKKWGLVQRRFPT